MTKKPIELLEKEEQICATCKHWIPWYSKRSRRGNCTRLATFAAGCVVVRGSKQMDASKKELQRCSTPREFGCIHWMSEAEFVKDLIARCFTQADSPEK